MALTKNDIWTVVPTIRPACLKKFLSNWGDVFGGRLIVVEDNAERSAEITEMMAACGGKHVSWREIDADLGVENAWLIPRKSDCVRSYGILMAHRLGAEAILTLDDDCYPPPGCVPDHWIVSHLAHLEVEMEDAWVLTVYGDPPRGFPYHASKRGFVTHVNHGLWLNVPDYDGPTQLVRSRTASPSDIDLIDQVIPKGKFFPMCGMNLSWRREATPCMYFLLMGKQHPFDRFGDIWCGLFMKKIADHLGWRIHSGGPFVYHSRASDVFANIQKEASGLPVNEELWKRVDTCRIDHAARTASDAYLSLIDGIDFDGLPEPQYWPKLREAVHKWVLLCSQ